MQALFLFILQYGDKDLLSDSLFQRHIRRIKGRLCFVLITGVRNLLYGMSLIDFIVNHYEAIGFLFFMAGSLFYLIFRSVILNRDTQHNQPNAVEKIISAIRL